MSVNPWRDYLVGTLNGDARRQSVVEGPDHDGLFETEHKLTAWRSTQRCRRRRHPWQSILGSLPIRASVLLINETIK